MTGIHEFWRIFLAILPSRSRSVRLCYKNGRFVSSGLPIQEQVDALNRTLRGHYAYYGVAGNIRALQRVHRFVERYWRKMLCSRSWAGRHLTWAAFNRLTERVPLLRPRLRLPYRALQALVVL